MAEEEIRFQRAVRNAGILALYTFSTCLIGIGAAGLLVDPYAGILAAGLSAFAAFMSRIVLEYGLTTQNSRK